MYILYLDQCSDHKVEVDFVWLELHGWYTPDHNFYHLINYCLKRIQIKLTLFIKIFNLF